MIETTFPFNAPGVSDEYKVAVLARVLSGYDEITWNKLSENRKRTYTRAASILLYDYNRITELINVLCK